MELGVASAPASDVRQWDGLNRERAERVAQVVEDDRIVLRAQPSKVGGIERGVEALPCRAVMERHVLARGEDEIVGPRVVSATAEAI